MSLLLHADPGNAQAIWTPEGDPSKLDWTPVDQPLSFTFRWMFSGTPSDWSNYRYIGVGSDSPGNNILGRVLHGTGTNFYISLSIYNSSWSEIARFETTSPVTLSADTLYHIAVVASSAGNNKIYLNKVSQSVTDTTWTANTAIDVGYENIGFENTSENNYSHYKMWNKAISQTEIDNDFANPYQYDSDGNCILSLHFDENTGTNANDVQTQFTQTDASLENGATWGLVVTYKSYITITKNWALE